MAIKDIWSVALTYKDNREDERFVTFSTCLFAGSYDEAIGLGMGFQKTEIENQILTLVSFDASEICGDGLKIHLEEHNYKQRKTKTKKWENVKLAEQ